MSAELIRAQAADLHGVEIGERRAAELAADIARLNDAVSRQRPRLDFNDEPARFAALLMGIPDKAGKRK